MNIESFREYCLSFPYAEESTPFGSDTLVFKVKDRMFALTDLTSFESINLKCDPFEAMELRDKYPAVIPGYHMNKKHWNTILMNGSIPDTSVKTWIDNSFQLVLAKLKKADRLEVEQALEKKNTG